MRNGQIQSTSNRPLSPRNVAMAKFRDPGESIQTIHRTEAPARRCGYTSTPCMYRRIWTGLLPSWRRHTLGDLPRWLRLAAWGWLRLTTRGAGLDRSIPNNCTLDEVRQPRMCWFRRPDRWWRPHGVYRPLGWEVRRQVDCMYLETDGLG